MMSQQPDKFFHEKLHNYQRPVPSGAWARVAQNVQKKNRLDLYLKVAAALLLVALGTMLVYPSFNQKDSELASNLNDSSQEATNPPVASQQEPDNLRTDSPAQTDNTEVLRTPSRPKVRTTPRQTLKSGAKNPVVIAPEETPPIEVGHENDLADNAATDPTLAESPATPDDKPVVADTRTGDENMTIVFTLDEVNSKYLTKNTDAEATNDDEQPSGLKKLLDKAYDLKHNQDPLGSLRQKKNEILAMNFRSEKASTQND